MSNSVKGTTNGAAASAVGSPHYLPYKVKLEDGVNQKSPTHGTSPCKDFSINLIDMSMEKLIMMMRTEAIHMKDYIEAMPPSQSSLLSDSQMSQLMSEHVGLSPAEILQKTEHQLLLAISKQLETIDEFESHLGTNISSGIVNAMQDLCSFLNKQHSCMRSQQHKLPEPSSSELGNIISRLEKISSHIYVTIPKLKLEITTTGRNSNNLKRCATMPASPSKLVIKKSTVASPSARRQQEEVKAKDAAASPQKSEDVLLLMMTENQTNVEEGNISPGEDNHENLEDSENDALMIDPGDDEDETDVQLVHHTKRKGCGFKNCSKPKCRVMVAKDDPHSCCTSHSPCMSSSSFDPTACTVCLDLFQRANSGEKVARRIWTARRLRTIRTCRYKKDLSTRTGSWASPEIESRFKLRRSGQGSAVKLVRKSPTPSTLAPVPPLIRIEMQNPNDEHVTAENEASQQEANNDLLKWKAVLNLIDDFFGKPDSPAIPYIRMIISVTEIESAFAREILMFFVSELEEQLTLLQFNGIQQKRSNQDEPRFETDNIQNKLEVFRSKLLALLGKHDIPMSHIESYLSPIVGVINKGIASLAAQEWLSPEQSGMLLPTGGSWETQFVEGSVKTHLQSLQLSQQALHALQEELQLQLRLQQQTSSTVAAKRLGRSPSGVSNGDALLHQKTSVDSGCQQHELAAWATMVPSTLPAIVTNITQNGKGSAEQLLQQQQEQYLLQHLSLKRVGDKNYGSPTKKAKTGSFSISSPGVVNSQSAGLKPMADTSVDNVGSQPTIPANERYEKDRLMMRQLRGLVTQMEMPLSAATASSQPTPHVNTALQPHIVSSIRDRPSQASVNVCGEMSGVQTQRALSDLHQPGPCSDVGLPLNGVRRDSVNALQPATNTSTTASNSPAQGHMTPATASSDSSTSHSRKQLAPRRTVRLGCNRPQVDIIVASSSSAGDGRVPANNSPSISSSNCSSIGSTEGGSRRNSQEIDDGDVCEIVENSQHTVVPHSVRPSDGSEGTIQKAALKSNTVVNGASPRMSNGVSSSARNSVASHNGPVAPRIYREIAPKIAPNFGCSNDSGSALRSYPAAAKRCVNGTSDSSKTIAEDAEPHPGEGWFQAPVQALFKMIDNEFVMRFHGNMYKSPEVELQYFNKKMWFKVILNCTKTAHLLKYVGHDTTVNSRYEKAKALRLDVFKRITQIFSKSFTPTANISTKNFCSINIEHFPSQIQHLIYKEKVKEATKPLPSTRVKTDDQKFDLDKFIERHWIYDLCSTDECTKNFLNYLEQKDPSINSYSSVLNKTDELMRLKEEESHARARLLKMSTILCGQELITDILSKFNAQIDNTYTQQFRISNGYGVDESATACSSSNLDSGLGMLTGNNGLRATPVERTIKETLIQLEQFHRGVETQSNSLMAVLMEEAAKCKLNWRRLMLSGDETSPVAQRLLRSNVYTVNVFDEAVVEEVRKELKIKSRRLLKKKEDEQSIQQQSSGAS